MSTPIQVQAKRVSQEGFVWYVYDPAGGRFVEIDPRTGEILMTSAGALSDEMQAVAGAISEWCHTDARNYLGKNRKKILAALNYKASTY